MFAAALLLAALAAPPPPAREHFRDEAAPTHFVRVTDLGTREIVRLDGPDSALAAPAPLGDAERLLLALAGVERARLDPDARVPCDSTCWAKGAHGEPDLTEALAWSCDSWVDGAWRAVGRQAVAELARGVGLGGSAVGPDGGLAVTAKQWTDLWGAASSGSLEISPAALSILMRAAGLAVSSPRGAARGLYHRAHRVLAVIGSSDDGTWVTGVLTRRDERWAFALFVRGGSPRLAATRAADLLLETARTYERSTSERGGRPLSPLDER